MLAFRLATQYPSFGARTMATNSYCNGNDFQTFYGLKPRTRGHYTQNDLGELPQNHAEKPRLLQLSEWGDEMSNDELPASYIRYMIEWKFTVNKRVISRGTKEDVSLTPSAFWPLTLGRKLEKLLEGKTARKGRVRPDDTSNVVSVNDRSQRDLTKRYDNLDIGWTTVENQLLRWGEVFSRGKNLRLSFTFNYIEDDRFSRTTSGRVEKRGKTSVTKRMLNERDAQLDAEENVTGQQSIWRGVYNLMRCPSPSCHLGPHCWQDLRGKKHYALRSHHLKRLIAFVEKGGALGSHDNVPDSFCEELYMEEQQRLESQHTKNNINASQPCLQPQADKPPIVPETLPQANGQTLDCLDTLSCENSVRL
ncbi:hypothetical protein MPDQ_005492, partial [Monascus purpureus]